LIARGASNPEIAEELVFAVDTVKRLCCENGKDAINSTVS